MGRLVAGRVHPGLVRGLTSGCVSIAYFPSPGRPTNAGKRCVTIEGRTSFGPVHMGQIVTQTGRNRLCVDSEHLQLVEETPVDYGHTTG